MQTHLLENRSEIAWVRELFPTAPPIWTCTTRPVSCVRAQSWPMPSMPKKPISSAVTTPAAPSRTAPARTSSSAAAHSRSSRLSILNAASMSASAATSVPDHPYPCFRFCLMPTRSRRGCRQNSIPHRGSGSPRLAAHSPRSRRPDRQHQARPLRRSVRFRSGRHAAWTDPCPNRRNPR